ARDRRSPGGRAGAPEAVHQLQRGRREHRVALQDRHLQVRVVRERTEHFLPPQLLRRVPAVCARPEHGGLLLTCALPQGSEPSELPAGGEPGGRSPPGTNEGTTRERSTTKGGR